MGKPFAKMRVLLIMAVAMVVLDSVESYPINDGEAAINNVRDAADREAQTATDNAANLEAQAAKEEKTVEENENFAAETTQRIKTDDLKLQHMNAEEEMSIANAKKMQSDASTHSANEKSLEEIVNVDKAEEQLTANIDREAVQVDNSYKRIKRDLEDANVPRRDASAMKKVEKKVRLGEMQKLRREDDPPGMQLSGDDLDRQELEAKANEMSTGAKVKEAEAAKREQAARATLTEMSEYASKGYAAITKAEQQLANDLNGHTDEKLEKDIEAKEQDIEERKQGNLGSSTGVEPKDPESEDGENTSTTDTDNTSANDQDVVSRNGIKRVEPKDPESEDGENTSTGDTDNTSANDQDVVSRNANFQRPRENNDRHAVSNMNSAVQADLSAIDQDSEQLERYQKSSQEEIKTIRQAITAAA